MRLLKAILFSFGMLLAALPARATILFAGGEDLDFTCVGQTCALMTSTTSGRYRSGWARLGLNPVASSAVDPPSQYIQTPVVANQTTLWVHGEIATNSITTVSNEQLLGVYGSDGVRRLLLRGTGSQNLKISTRNTAGTITDIVTCTASTYPVGPAFTLTALDWFINYAVAGHTTLYINGVQVCDFAGDVTTNSVTAVNRADFADTTGSGNGTYWSEEILANTNTRGLGFLTCFPSANGTNMTWNGSFANVNPTTINDASAINTGSTSQIAEFTCPALPSGTFSVPAVTQSARVVTGNSGPQSFYFIARPSSGSTDYNNGSAQTGTTAFTNYSNIWATNPATSTAWVPADVTTGVNFGIESQP